MKKGVFIFSLFLIQLSQAKTILIGLNTNHVSGNDKSYSQIRGGDTLLLEAGKRGSIQFANIAGSPKQYVTIINADSLCEINESVLPYGISLRNCHYVRLAGNGSKKNQYGIKIAGVSHDGAGLGISDKSDYIEICHIEICNTKGPGILCKTNPDCFTNRENYTSLNTCIHHNYVHHTGTEGMYIGSTAFEGSKIKCDSAIIIRFPPLLENVEVFENLVEYTGWDGIQISNAINVKCYRNKIYFDSQKDEPWQNCGLIIGGGATGRFYDNLIANGKGYPINCFGTGNLEITNNHIIQDSNSTKTAIYINDKLADAGTHYIISGNAINTQHFPAITIISKKQRRPDLIKSNSISAGAAATAISYEGVKPIVK